jgi:hypothetical protein
MSDLKSMSDSDSNYDLVCQICKQPNYLREDGKTCETCKISNCA